MDNAKEVSIDILYQKINELEKRVEKTEQCNKVLSKAILDLSKLSKKDLETYHEGYVELANYILQIFEMISV